jgi:thiamine-monophosphate kinase
LEDKESFFISLFKNKYIGDDGAIIGDQIFSKDLFCEDIHFKKGWMSLQEIAYKSMLINISDAIVMNAHPKYALIGIKIPSFYTPFQMEELSKGFVRASREFDFEIIGGDTVAGDKLDISITLISESKKPIRRDNIQEGSLIAYTGDLGSVKKDLDALLNDQSISQDSKFITPKLRGNFFYEASHLINSALDISDGLSKDLSRLSKLNNIGFKFFSPLDKDILCSGEEYEILFSFYPLDEKEIKEIAKKHNLKINIIAQAIEGKYQSECEENHF